MRQRVSPTSTHELNKYCEQMHKYSKYSNGDVHSFNARHVRDGSDCDCLFRNIKSSLKSPASLRP